MTNYTLEETPDIESLPANSDCWTFVKTNYFGKNYFNFNGRASRREYWISTLIINLITTAVFTVFVAMFPNNLVILNSIDALLSLYLLIPNLALCSRRFHDINLRAWWSLGVIPLLFLPFFKGDKFDNRFGRNIYDEIEV